MVNTKIGATVVAHSLNEQGDELISVLCSCDHETLKTLYQHDDLSITSTNILEIPFNKMVEAVQNDPFIPIAWQKDHKGMQGNEYITDDLIVNHRKGVWLQARDRAIHSAIQLNGNLIRYISGQDEGKILEGTGVTKQLCNRLLEPFMWTTMLITSSREGWDNFFNLRNPSYEISTGAETREYFKSKKDLLKKYPSMKPENELDWFYINKGQAEIHMMTLAECIWDAVNESTPKQLKVGEWHIPFEDKLNEDKVAELYYEVINNDRAYNHISSIEETKVKISTAMAARTSYTVVGDEKVVNYENLITLHDRLLTQEPPHSSPFEHCARAMSDEEYFNFVKGERYSDGDFEDAPTRMELGGTGWCYNLKGFISYRYLIDNKVNL